MSKEKIIDRIKKLLSLANSSNEHEAANAAAQAAELMLKHEIEEAQLDEGEEGEVEDVGEEKIDETGQRVPWKATLQYGLAQSFGCDMYTHRTYKKDTRKMVCRYMVVGQPSKVATIKYMYQYLVGEIDRLADKAYREEHLECRKSGVPAPSARSWKNAFRLGAASTIYKRLLAQRKKTHKEALEAGKSTALVVVKKAEEAVAVYVKQHHPNMKSAPRAQYSSRSGYGAGQEAGRNVRLGGSAGALGRGAHQLGSGS